MSEQGDRKGRPIGFWLRRADQAISVSVNGALARLDLTRSHWQVLCLMKASGTASAGHLERELRDFVAASELDEILRFLEARGWLSRVAGPDGAPLIELTQTGERGHAEALEVQTQVRQRMMRGLSAEGYQMVIRVLETTVANLEADA